MVEINTDKSIIIKDPIQVSDDSLLYHDISNKEAVCGTYDGNIMTVNLEEKKIISEGTKAHDFSVWYTSYATGDSNIVYSASDDASFKKFDTRIGLQAPVYQNRKHHTAGVTCVRQLKHLCSLESAEHVLLTGSYDCSIAAWDERKLGREPVQSISTDERSVWDIKINPLAPNDWGVASIYDGYLFDINNSTKDEKAKSIERKNIDDLNFKQYKGHGSICYAFEWVNQLSTQGKTTLLTSSFYDSTLHLIQI